ncbi:MAG TPA: SDR family NAD(P)-dependent oxidoreductase [Bryobacteraceae bacterium]|nr:SDR family NAD(P)-dependent oxidoreductase [Bryobacteraceae bacterium]
MQRYEGKKVVIVGGTSGMGLTTAKMLLAGGARVIVTGRSKEGLESAQNELGNDAIVVSSDARSLTDLDALASRAKAEFGNLDLLYVNAGFSIRAPLEIITEAIYDEMFNLNAKGPLFAVQKYAAHKSRRLCRLHDLDRERKRYARPSRIRSGQGRAAIVCSDARRRVASARDSRQRGDAWSHQHADTRQSVPR